VRALLEACGTALAELRRQQPLIHCLTGHVTINDSANGVLACGGRPIMSEHPAEAAEVTSVARALVLNLNNISDSRMEAMRASAPTAQRLGLPITLDPVGVTCSTLRREFARELVQQKFPTILRGNLSEIRVMAGLSCRNAGIDAGDAMEPADIGRMVKELARQQGFVVVATGAVDVISDGKQTVGIHNGTPLLGSVTGTGCLCGAMTGAYSAVAEPFVAAVTATLAMGVAGELAQRVMERETAGMGTFKTALFDALWQLDGKILSRHARLEQL
jgi:hydroxyethylthiazole kinase